MTDRTESTHGDASAVDPSLAGLRGWLILPAIGLVLSLGTGIVGLIAGFVQFPGALDAGLGLIYGLEVAVMIGLLLFTLYAAIQFFGKMREAPKVMIALIATGLGVSMLFAVLEVFAAPESISPDSLRGVYRDLISAAIWIPYFHQSKRVRATFVN